MTPEGLRTTEAAADDARLVVLARGVLPLLVELWDVIDTHFWARERKDIHAALERLAQFKEEP
jgi:hypothetical protein